jgi:hypothetical protein
MEVSGQIHDPATLPPRKEPLVPIGWEAGWVLEPVWTRWWREKFPASAGLEPSIIQPVALRCTTELGVLKSYINIEYDALKCAFFLFSLVTDACHATSVFITVLLAYVMVIIGANLDAGVSFGVGVGL